MGETSSREDLRPPLQGSEGGGSGAPTIPLPQQLPPLPAVRGKDEWDIFISYSRKDKAFVWRLYAALGSYRPPRTLPVPQRYLKPFIDESDAYGPDYEGAIHGRLRSSARLLVVCSPNARASRFIDPEIRAFLASHASSEIIS